MKRRLRISGAIVLVLLASAGGVAWDRYTVPRLDGPEAPVTSVAEIASRLAPHSTREGIDLVPHVPSQCDEAEDWWCEYTECKVYSTAYGLVTAPYGGTDGFPLEVPERIRPPEGAPVYEGAVRVRDGWPAVRIRAWAAPDAPAAETFIKDVRTAARGCDGTHVSDIQSGDKDEYSLRTLDHAVGGWRGIRIVTDGETGDDTDSWYYPRHPYRFGTTLVSRGGLIVELRWGTTVEPPWYDVTEWTYWRGDASIEAVLRALDGTG